MAVEFSVAAPVTGVVLEISGSLASQYSAGTTILVLESMKVQIPVVMPDGGILTQIAVSANEVVEIGTTLFNWRSTQIDVAQINQSPDVSEAGQSPLHLEAEQRHAQALDAARGEAVARRHARGYRSARENLADLVDPDSFVEYGQLAVAAQRQRRKLSELQTETAADGVITGIGRVNSALFGAEQSQTAIVVYDYTVLAGTQGFFHHQKLDRIIEVAGRQGLPVIMYTEGGGGRPGDTDVVTMSTGLHCHSFTAWAGLVGVVPRIAIANGYNFAGNAALFGAADITIATRQSWVGMAGPAMIEGGGLGEFKATDIGPIEVQEANGVVDIVAADEADATVLAQRVLAVFQGDIPDWESSDQSSLNDAMPANRRYTYDVRAILTTVLDQGSFIEIRRRFGGAIICGFARIKGRSIGILASDCAVLGGAIDVDAATKAAEFMRLCNAFGIPLVSFCDTPGFMVGPEHEARGAVRRVTDLFTAGSQLDVPLVGVVMRKCYGLGAQALLGGSTLAPDYTVAWASGEFGGMGLEGAVRLGFKRELEAVADTEQRQALFEQLLQAQYDRGKAVEVATMLEIDAVIAPQATRETIVQALGL